MEAPLFIREHARNIRHFVAELFTQYRGWPGPADSSANEFICAELSAAIAQHEAAAWQPTDQPPGRWRIVLAAVQYSKRKTSIIVVPAEHNMGKWWRISADGGTHPLDKRDETLLGWRDMPPYVAQPLDD